MSAGVIAALAVSTVPLVRAVDTSTTSTSTTAEATPTAEPAREGTGIVVPAPTDVDYQPVYGSHQASFLRLSDGMHVGSASERLARPALSLAKLYIAEYVLNHGTTEEKIQAIAMLTDSSDATAQQLYRTYPESIDETAKKYQLHATRGAEKWGSSTTSTYDVVHFIAALATQSPMHPILAAMALSKDRGADGYPQDYGTIALDGELGTKWGWSDDHTFHSSVSFGEGWVAAAMIAGSPDDLTNYAEAQLGELATEAEAAAETSSKAAAKERATSTALKPR
ncbi:hypothetical protein CUTER_03235 [Corynebacterium uterequi]|uniref:Beta-lactamase enzyme family n=1 Tax=Corynebacterium uterequi TaxID=1072256 RepID=A0A0G3HBA5_9CORY|nr:hypothetical protein CUTER_03235 [Corynebacterium uterequi]